MFEQVQKELTSGLRETRRFERDVDVIATYELSNVNRTRVENLIHRVFDSARLDLEINDRFGQQVMPREA